MSAWREETSRDLGSARVWLESAGHSLSGEPTEEQMSSVWKAYVAIEKSIVFIRVDIEEENPGRFLRTKTYSVPDERQALAFAMKNLEKGTQSFRLGDFQRALKELRESRNYLRALLREKRLRKNRNARSSSP